MILDLEEFTTRVVTVRGLQLTHGNMHEAAALTGSVLVYPVNKEPYFKLTTEMGHVEAKAGMWIVQVAPGKYVAMTDKNFRRKYIRKPTVQPALVFEAEDGSEISPPSYRIRDQHTPKELQSYVVYPHMTDKEN